MTDPMTLTAGAIATLAFQEFIKAGAGEVAKKFTTEAIAKMGELRKLIWHRLSGKHPIAEDALNKAIAGDENGIQTVTKLLDVELLDKEFDTQIQAIANLVQQEISKDNSGAEIKQTVTGNQNQVIGQVSGGKVFGNVQGNIDFIKG